MTVQASKQLECPQCGNHQAVTVWRSINVSLDPSLRDKLFDRRINVFRFVVQLYPPEAIEDDRFVRMFEPSQPVTMKGSLAQDAGYLARPHLVFDMDEMAHCIAFFERLLPTAAGQAGEEEA